MAERQQVYHKASEFRIVTGTLTATDISGGTVVVETGLSKVHAHGACMNADPDISGGDAWIVVTLPGSSPTSITIAERQDDDLVASFTTDVSWFAVGT